MKNRFKCFIAALFALPMTGLIPLNASAQSWPSRPITYIYPFPPGGPSEAPLRAAATEASRLLGQPVVFENRPGANSRLSIVAMRNAPPDGYLISAVIDGVLTSQPLLDPEFKFQPLRDYAPVALQVEATLRLMGPTSLPFKDIKGLIDYAKANPRKLNVAVTIGSSSHIIAERIREAAGIEVTMVGYKGSSQSYVDLVAGRVDLVVGSDKALVDAGKLIALATTGRQRWAGLPNVPTLVESGIPVVTSLWYGVIAHPNTPPEIVAKLNNAFNAAVRTPAFNKRVETSAFTAMAALTPEGMAAFIRSEMTALEPVIRKAGIKME